MHSSKFSMLKDVTLKHNKSKLRGREQMGIGTMILDQNLRQLYRIRKTGFEGNNSSNFMATLLTIKHTMT